MARRLLLVVLALALLAVVAPAVRSAPAGERQPRELGTSACNVVKVGTRGYVLYRRGVPCVTAKRWVRRLATSKGRTKPPGYSCSSGSGYRTGGYCERGDRHFGWHPGD